MALENDLIRYLGTRAAITALVGSGQSMRVYPLRLPQRVVGQTQKPAITYRRRTGGHDHDLGGSAGTAMPTIQFDCWAETYQAAVGLGDVLRENLQGASGTLGSTAGSTSVINSIVLADEADDFEPYEDGSDNGVYVRSQLYRVRYLEAVPTL